MNIKKKELLDNDRINEYIKIIGAFINPSFASQLTKKDNEQESYDPFFEKTLENIEKNIKYGR